MHFNIAFAVFKFIKISCLFLQTQTEYRTLTPTWNKIFTFAVKDITSILDVTVYDEDRHHKTEFLGKISIPLWRIKNGEKKWYTLKDRKLIHPARGTNPQILLEMEVAWNPVRLLVYCLKIYLPIIANMHSLRHAIFLYLKPYSFIFI